VLPTVTAASAGEMSFPVIDVCEPASITSRKTTSGRNLFSRIVNIVT
jgi:hypothetical protein